MSTSPMDVPKFIEFRGRKYALMGSGKYYLSQSTKPKERINPKGLHVAIWEHATGKHVPAGWHVHHKDGDTFNNDPVNLECLSARDHAKLPKNFNRQRMRENLNRIRPLAKRWHGSPAGLEWHRRNAVAQWKTPRTKSLICLHCSNAFKSPMGDTKYCSARCCYLARFVVLACCVCRKIFKRAPERKSPVCSWPCRSRLRAGI